jgi:hypothetical protein
MVGEAMKTTSTHIQVQARGDATGLYRVVDTYPLKRWKKISPSILVEALKQRGYKKIRFVEVTRRVMEVF